MAELKIAGLCKKFGAVQVLHDVDVDIADGEFVALVGPSGCGKSTLLRSIAGLEDISAGQIHVGDRTISDLAPKHRNVAMVFQNYALYPHMTVEQNMGFSLKLARVDPSEISRRVAETARILGLETMLDRKPKQLSGGQRQRVAMGRAIVRSPDVFLFDEPLSNLDAKLRVQMRTEIRSLHQRLGTTTVYVTHDQIEAMTMADKIVVLRDGRVEQIGTPLDLYDRPRNTFVASFIGSPAMNMLEGTIRAGRFESETGAAFPLPDRYASSDGARVVYGIRPDAVQLDDAGREVTVEVVEQNGAESFCVLRDGPLSYNMMSKSRLDLRAGDKIKAGFQKDSAHVFDSATQEVLAPVG